MSRFNFQSPLSAASDAMVQLLAEREAQKRQQMLDEITQRNSDSLIEDRKLDRESLDEDRKRRREVDAENIATLQATRAATAQSTKSSEFLKRAGTATPRAKVDPSFAAEGRELGYGHLFEPGEEEYKGMSGDDASIPIVETGPETFTGTAEQHSTARDQQIREDANKAAATEREADNASRDAYQKEQLEIARMNANTARQNANTTQNRYTLSGLDTTMPTEFRNPAERAVLFVPPTRKPAFAALVNRLHGEGNTAELKDVIRQGAIEGENVDTKNQILGRQATLAALVDTRAILKDIEKAGVNTGIIAGTVEDLHRKLGTSSNPQLAALANRLQGTLINYRRAATGVAFGEREAAQYDKMFPNYKNDLPVNLALIEGLVREMNTYDKTYWTHKIGPEGARLVGVVTDEPQSSPDDVLPRQSGGPGANPAADALRKKYGY